MHEVTISRECAMVAACCRWPLTADGTAELQRLAQAPLDWEGVCRIARRHRVFALVHHALRVAGVACPSAIRSILEREAFVTAQRSCLLADETLRLQAILDRASIPVLVLKGVALAQRAYGRPTLKHGRDIDLIVPQQHALAALRLLEQDGYSLVDPARELTGPQREAFIGRGHEMELRHPERDVRVELHWRLSENPFLTHGIDAFVGGQSVALPGGPVRTLNDADLFAYLCVHGANHFWFRLKWLADLDALLGQIDDAGLTALYRHAQAHGAGLCAAQALLLCHRVLRRPLPDALRADLESNHCVLYLVYLALRDMVAPRIAEGWSRRVREMRWRFLLGRGLPFVMTQCAITLTAPADVVRWPLPRPLRFVYPLIRLPSWVLRRW